MFIQEDDRHGHRKQLVTDIRITFADNPRRGGRGGRGGRGRGGPRGEGRGGPRGGRGGGFNAPPERSDRPRGPRESAPRMDDETDFPRLVKSEAWVRSESKARVASSCCLQVAYQVWFYFFFFFFCSFFSLPAKIKFAVVVFNNNVRIQFIL